MATERPVTAERVRYRFGPRQQRGLIAGWRGGQIVTVAAGLLVAMAALRWDPSVGGAVVSLAVVAGAVGLACWPIAGRTGEEWFPVVVEWSSAGASRRRLRRSPRPGQGHCLEGADVVPAASAPSRPAGPFGGLSVLGWSPGLRTPVSQGCAVVRDVPARTYTAVLSLRGHSFALLGPEEKERRVAGWSGALAALAREGSQLHRLAWVASTLPDDGRGAARYLESEAVLDPRSEPHRSYAELLGVTGADACRHEVLLAVQIRQDRSTARSIRAAGGGVVGACTVLRREVETLGRLLADADVPVEEILGPEALVRRLRQSFESAPSPSPPDKPGPASDSAPSPFHPWPLALAEEWGQVRTDATAHATYWISEWPRVDVGSDFLGPVLLGTVRRTVAVVMEPLSPSQAVRQVEQARTADLADSELRRRGGFLSTARRVRETEFVSRREAELADGHASFRFSGYVTVTAPTPEQLREACVVTEQAAGQARLELRRLYGEQARALACTLPLCRGLD